MASYEIEYRVDSRGDLYEVARVERLSADGPGDAVARLYAKHPNERVRFQSVIEMHEETATFRRLNEVADQLAKEVPLYALFSAVTKTAA